MPMLRINGTTVTVADNSFQMSNKEVNPQVVRPGGGTRLIADRQSMRRSWTFKTTPMTLASATTLKALVHSGGGNPILTVDGDGVPGTVSCFGTVTQMETISDILLSGPARVLSITLDER